MSIFKKSKSAQQIFEEQTDGFDSDQFIRKMRGDDIPERLVNFDKKYRMADFSLMMKTMLISLEILAERIKKD